MYDLKCLKFFVNTQARGTKDIFTEPACVKTIQNYSNLLTGAWKPKYRLISIDLIECITNVSSHVIVDAQYTNDYVRRLF